MQIRQYRGDDGKNIIIVSFDDNETVTINVDTQPDTPVSPIDAITDGGNPISCEPFNWDGKQVM